jgi:hypothetical protein
LEEQNLREYMIYLHKTKLSLIKQILNKDNEIENMRKKILRIKDCNEYSIEEKNKIMVDMIMNLANFKQDKKETLKPQNKNSFIDKNNLIKHETINLEDSLNSQNEVEVKLNDSLSEGSCLQEKNKQINVSQDLDKSNFKENYTFTDNYENSRNSFIHFDNSYNWSNRSLLSSNKNSNLNFNNMFYKKSLHSHLNKPTGNKLLNFRSPSKNENSQSEKILNTNDSNLSSSSTKSPRKTDYGFFNIKSRINLNSSLSNKSNTDSNAESPYKQSYNHVDFILGSKTKRKYSKLKSVEKKNSGLTQTNIKDIFEKFKK